MNPQLLVLLPLPIFIVLLLRGALRARIRLDRQAPRIAIAAGERGPRMAVVLKAAITKAGLKAVTARPETEAGALRGAAAALRPLFRPAADLVIALASGSEPPPGGLAPDILILFPAADENEAPGPEWLPRRGLVLIPASEWSSRLEAVVSENQSRLISWHEPSAGLPEDLALSSSGRPGEVAALLAVAGLLGLGRTATLQVLAAEGWVEPLEVLSEGGVQPRRSEKWSS